MGVMQFWRISLVSMTALALSFPSASADIDNKYGLILQGDFPNRFKEVETYWREHSKTDTFTGVKGIPIAYATLLHPNERAAVVISSGRTESFVKYKELAYDLARQRYSVYIHDHRGQGFSKRMLPDPHKGHVDDFDEYVQDLATFVRDIVKARPHAKLLLLAHSMGGGIATRFIQSHPDVFSAAALSSPMHAPNAKILVSPEGGCQWFRFTQDLCRDCYVGFLAKPYDPEPFDDNEYTQSRERYAALLKAFKDNPEAQLGGPTRGWAAQACTASEAMLRDVGKVRIPVLVLQAGADTAVTAEAQNRFCEGLHAQTGKACYRDGPVLIEGARHELLIEADRFRIPAVTTILDFFAAH